MFREERIHLLLSRRPPSYHDRVRQIILRVPDDVHARIAARAARDGRSVNQLATEILDAAADADHGTRTDRLRAHAAAAGMLRRDPASKATPADATRSHAIDSMRGTGPLLDVILDEDRDRG